MPQHRSRRRRSKGAGVIDLFCGAGGLSHGFLQEGFPILAGYDIDEACRYPFETNNRAPFFATDVAKLKGAELRKLYPRQQPSILVGCAPCQPFSTYNQGNDDPKWRLLQSFARIIEEARPDVVSMENVPALTRFDKGRTFASFERRLVKAGYQVWWDVVDAQAYGVPQTRRRLVLLGSRLGPIELIPPEFAPKDYKTVKHAISDLPRLKAGAYNRKDPMHRASGMSELNLQRIKASKPGGTWRDWDGDLVTECHTKGTGRGYVSVYGRMAWGEPSPTLTTQFYGFGNGRFGHPTQDRALSLREGAIIQTFPPDYAFVEPGAPVSFKTIGRLIGNAVPVALGRAVAKSVAAHLAKA
jgi:DNA (cytosine-5)-methyltransferase 1